MPPATGTLEILKPNGYASSRRLPAITRAEKDGWSNQQLFHGRTTRKPTQALQPRGTASLTGVSVACRFRFRHQITAFRDSPRKAGFALVAIRHT